MPTLTSNEFTWNNGKPCGGRWATKPFILVCLLLTLVPALAQEPAPTLPAPADYPSWAALNANPIPPADALQLARELRGVSDVPPPPSVTAARQVGELQDFWIVNDSESRTFQVEAELRVVGEHIYLWVQRDVEIDLAALTNIAAEFDGRIYRKVRDLWGEEASPGVDGDRRIYALFAYGMGSGVAAYFASRNVYPVEVYPTSNAHEMFLVNLDAFGTVGLDSRALLSTLAHEFQHMIRANIQDNEATYLNEGYSTFTQIYLYDDADAVMWYLEQPDTQLNAWAEGQNRAANYGAAQLFITYFYDRFGRAGLQALSRDAGLGMDAVDNTLRGLGHPGADDFMAEWALANLLNDPTVADGIYFYPTLPDLPAPNVTRPLRRYPAEVEGEAQQYGVDYFPLTNLEGIEQLSIMLEAPAQVPLVEAEPTSGRWMWYSQRGDASAMTLTRAFDLTGVTSATLDYNVWFDIEDDWDYAYLQVSTDGGATWAILPTPHTTDSNPHAAAYGPGYTGQSFDWVSESVSLDAYAGQNILVRFQMITDDAINQPGLLLDDVRVPEIGYSSDFETDGGGWEAAGWARIDNVLPQQAWVMLVQRAGEETRIDRWRAQGGGSWTAELLPGVDSATLVIMPFAPVTTEPLRYRLSVSGP